MSLTDTAEYWWDIKRKIEKKTFIHAKGLDCGHFHVVETLNVNFIDCYACLAIIKEKPEIAEELMKKHRLKEKQRLAKKLRSKKKKKKKNTDLI